MVLFRTTVEISDFFFFGNFVNKKILIQAYCYELFAIYGDFHTNTFRIQYRTLASMHYVNIQYISPIKREKSKR